MGKQYLRNRNGNNEGPNGMREKLIILGLVIGLIGFGKGIAFADSATWDFTTPGDYTVSDAEKVEVADGVAKFKKAYNNIGTPGAQGFGVGAYPLATLPSGFSALEGSADKTSDNYGNYQFQDGSIMVYIPKFYYRIGHADNPTYGTYGVNSIDVKSIYDYTTRTAAEADGYALHRAFIDGGTEKDGFFFDKYMCSQNSYGGEEIASSIKNGNPISTASAHNPIANLTACAGNYYYETINAAHGRGTIFQVGSRFQYSALAILSMAHGQASSATTYCAWYDATYNFPKGCNNNALSDTNDTTVIWKSDGYSNCGKTGSAGYGGGAGNVFAKSTHNGQNCGVADLNGLMWEISLGVTRPGTSGTDTTNQNDTANFYILKELVAMKDLQSGWHSGAAGAAYEAWGDAAHLALYYDQTTIAHIIPNTGAWEFFGSGGNQVLSEATSGTNWLFTGIGIPKDNNGDGATGTNLFGKDGIYKYHRANLCLISCAGWGNGSRAGVWYVDWYYSRTGSYADVGFRAACYPE